MFPKTVSERYWFNSLSILYAVVMWIVLHQIKWSFKYRWVDSLNKTIQIKDCEDLLRSCCIGCIRNLVSKTHTLMVASSEAVTMTEKTGWNMTRVTGARCPLRAYLSGGRGIHSLGSLFWPTVPPCVISSFASFNFDSNSITWGRKVSQGAEESTDSLDTCM